MAMAINDRGDLLGVLFEAWKQLNRYKSYAEYVQSMKSAGRVNLLTFEQYMGEKQQGDTTYGNC